MDYIQHWKPVAQGNSGSKLSVFSEFTPPCPGVTWGSQCCLPSPVSPPPPPWLSPPGLSLSSHDGRITMMEAFTSSSQMGYLIPPIPIYEQSRAFPSFHFPPVPPRFLGGKSSPSALLNTLNPTKEMLALPCCHGHTTQTSHCCNPPAATDLICLGIAFAARDYSVFIYICPETA